MYMWHIFQTSEKSCWEILYLLPHHPRLPSFLEVDYNMPEFDCCTTLVKDKKIANGQAGCYVLMVANQMLKCVCIELKAFCWFVSLCYQWVHTLLFPFISKSTCKVLFEWHDMYMILPKFIDFTMDMVGACATPLDNASLNQDIKGVL